jgi:hypothetical protein
MRADTVGGAIRLNPAHGNRASLFTQWRGGPSWNRAAGNIGINIVAAPMAFFLQWVARSFPGPARQGMMPSSSHPEEDRVVWPKPWSRVLMARMSLAFTTGTIHERTRCVRQAEGR